MRARNKNASYCILIIAISISTVCLAASEEYIATLEYIAEGYKANNSLQGSVSIEGRILHEQKAEKGKEIDSSRLFEPTWLTYKYFQKDGKRRYEQDRKGNPKERLYVFDNDKRIATYAPKIVKIFPIKDEESYWLNNAGLYGDFFYFLRTNDYMNVYSAMNTFIQAIKNGVYDGETAVMSLSEENGLFTIKTTEGNFECEFTIDSKKGFNLVGMKTYCPDPKFYREYTGKYDFQELTTGNWAFVSGSLTGIENGVVFEKRLETNKIETNVNLPDELFEIDSLHLPPDVYTLDYHFSPPLELNRGSTPDVDQLDGLLETDVGEAEIAQVKESGVAIQIDLAVENHRKKKNEPSELKGGKSETKFASFWLISGSLLAGLLIITAVTILKNGRRENA
jgi:hypothetical protein